ncbi:hypothetical protein MSG28_006192 [Choristoneura fumiferana]|uniref:Uncharacterized protein n=1 Tax=Choristoneura fumiferana TaxID=7141 RepID=A0ACC0JDW0_CHOFU|nr:hypothetical protein MSG28_006192 [Choristoneura fumiferana]
MWSIIILVILSIIAFLITDELIPNLKDLFIKAGLCGIDLCKTSKEKMYPSKVFVGDTFCYVSGMTFAVVAILSHFSKTVILFFLPQVINFIYSIPQLFHFIPCPRHRLPKYSAEIDLLQPSRTVIIKKDMKLLDTLVLKVLTMLRLVDKREDNEIININNLTLINLFLIKFGPMSEVRLTTSLMMFQIVCTCVAFIIRYPLASYFYDT